MPSKEQRPHPRRRHRRLVWIVAILAALVVIVVLLPRREGAMNQWMAHMRAKGEKFTFEELALSRTPQTNNIMDLIESAASRFKSLERARAAQPARVGYPFIKKRETNISTKVVGWAETNLYGAKGWRLDWEVFGTEAEKLQDIVRDLRAALENPPS